MNILFQSRVDMYNPRGGDTLQMEQTKAAIERLYPTIHIDIIPKVRVKDINKYDVVHLFNLDWICETYLQAKWAKKHNKPIVLSAIHHSEDEVRRFEKDARFDIRRLYNVFFPFQAYRDMGKNVYRSLFNKEKIYPTFVQLTRGIRSQQKEILKLSSVVLVQTEKEAHDIKKDFGVENINWRKVVNGVNTKVFSSPDQSKFFELLKNRFGESLYAKKKLLLNVGRVEPRKNQLKIIEAFEKLQKEVKEKWILVFIGAMGIHSIEYNLRFKARVSRNKSIFFVGPQSQEVVASAMAQNGVYVHPSWFETTGLVGLEATLAGMPVVGVGERMKEYLGEMAEYCDPSDVLSIKNAILKASKIKIGKDYRDMIKEKFSWDQTAKQTVEVYKNLSIVRTK